MIKKCKQCDWLTANNTYTICHACGGELQEFDITSPKLRLTKYAPDVAPVTSAEPDSGLESVPAVESDTQPRG